MTDSRARVAGERRGTRTYAWRDPGAGSDKQLVGVEELMFHPDHVGFYAEGHLLLAVQNRSVHKLREVIET